MNYVMNHGTLLALHANGPHVNAHANAHAYVPNATAILPILDPFFHQDRAFSYEHTYICPKNVQF